MLTELGHEPSVVGVAQLYAPIASALVIDTVDAHLAAAVEASRHALRGHGHDHVETRGRSTVGPRRARHRWPERRVTPRRGGRVPRRGRSTATSRGGSVRARARRRTAALRAAGPDRGPASMSPAPGTDAAILDHSSAIGVCTPVPMLMTSPLPFSPARTRASTTSSMNTKSRVCRPSPWSNGAWPLTAASTKAATTPPVGRCRRPVHAAERQRSELDRVEIAIRHEQIDDRPSDHPANVARLEL